MSTPDPLAPPSPAPPARQANGRVEVFIPDGVLPAMPEPPEPFIRLGRKRVRAPQVAGAFAMAAHAAKRGRVQTIAETLTAAGVPMRSPSEVASGVLTAQRDEAAGGTLYVWLPHAPMEKLPRVERDRAERKRQEISDREPAR